MSRSETPMSRQALNWTTESVKPIRCWAKRSVPTPNCPRGHGAKGAPLPILRSGSICFEPWKRHTGFSSAHYDALESAQRRRDLGQLGAGLANLGRASRILGVLVGEAAPRRAYRQEIVEDDAGPLDAVGIEQQPATQPVLRDRPRPSPIRARKRSKWMVGTGTSGWQKKSHTSFAGSSRPAYSKSRKTSAILPQRIVEAEVGWRQAAGGLRDQASASIPPRAGGRGDGRSSRCHSGTS